MPDEPVSRGGSTQEERVPFIKEHYGRLWDSTFGKAETILASGETNLARVHQFMRRDSGPAFADPELAEKYKRKVEQRREMGFILDRQLVQFHDVESTIATRITDAVKMREIIDACQDGIGRIVETGAGWGKGLFNLWLHGGPRDADYRALELTEAGRKTTELIARRVAQEIKIAAHEFDYFKPDFTCLAGDLPALFFSHHSLEQMPFIEEAFFDRVMAVPGFRRYVHLEPVGWQIPGDVWLAEPHSLRLMQKIDELNRNFSETKNQNRNLYPLLLDMERRGKIRITAVRKHLCSTLLQNATTLIVWEPASARPAGPAPERRDDRARAQEKVRGIAAKD